MGNEISYCITTQNLSIGYTTKDQPIVVASNLNIQLEGGKLVCLLGKNGIGKSTLLRTLTKVQPALKGTVLIKDKPLNLLKNIELSREISVVLTEKLPESNLTVFELIALGRQPYTNWIGKLDVNDLDKINEALEQTNTTHLKHKFYYQLSDGQLQKVLIARALAQDTAIIIFDEPTAHLDIHHTIETFSLLKNLAVKFNKTIIVSTHEINLSLQLADELWLMTPTNFICGETATLIENNSLDQLFDSNLIEFNKTLKQFIIKPSSHF
ncbi:ABC transporter ATP-binding protein [Lutibacter sp.]|uniref:ABC transporter ATP-binding protein n=1 Tax=Lutibacter sp. TaxID=1925666 RepID=UPI0027331B51|nr:ABC transporter ATP-binding protein [Lutibacter sp.]MDP3313520.1 ABC transporter ATP-binding protein [Lutibacter sp.]